MLKLPAEGDAAYEGPPRIVGSWPPILLKPVASLWRHPVPHADAELSTRFAAIPQWSLPGEYAVTYKDIPR